MDVCIHRWIDRTIFAAPYPTLPRATPRCTPGPSFSVHRASRRHRDYTGGGEGGQGYREIAEGPRCSLAMGLLAGSLVCIFIYEIAGRERDGRRLRAPAIPVGPAELIKTSGIMRESELLARAISQAE